MVGLTSFCMIFIVTIKEKCLFVKSKDFVMMKKMLRLSYAEETELYNGF